MPVNTHLRLLTPSPYNLGTQVVSVALNGSIKLRCNGGASGDSVNWTLLSNSNPDFVIGPPTSDSIDTGTTESVPVTITEALPGNYTTTAVIRDTDNAVNYTLIINASFVAAGSTLIANPTSVTFPLGVAGAPPATQVVVISNNTGANVTVTAVNMVGLPFTCLTATPFVVPNGGTFNITLQAVYDTVGLFSGSATLKSVLLDLVIQLNITVLFLISVDVLSGLTSAIILGFGGKRVVGGPYVYDNEKFDGTSFDFAEDCVLIFNGALWDNPGNEKTLRRLEVFYENVGLCNQGLRLDVSVWRPSLAPPAFDVAPPNTISIGDVSADLSERTAFFDVNLTGELIIAKLTRLSSTGPVSILGFTLHFEDRGEKVEGV